MRRLFQLLVILSLPLFGNAQAPTQACTSIQFGETYCERTTISWTNGNGNRRLVVVRKDMAVNFTPADGQFYQPKDTFGSIHSIQNGDNYVIHNGQNNSVILFGLEHNTKYFVTVYEFNRDPGTGATSFLTTNNPVDSFTTQWMDVSFETDTIYQCISDNSFDFRPVLVGNSSRKASYSWDFGDLTFSSDSFPTKEFTDDGVHTVSVRATTTGCRSEFQDNVVVVNVPLLDFGLDTTVNENDLIQCYYKSDGSPNRFYLKDVSSSSTKVQPNSTSLEWDFGDGTTNNLNRSPEYTYDEPGTYTIKLTLTLKAGPGYLHHCVATDSFTVEVKPRPLDSSLINFVDTFLCLDYNVFEFENNNTVFGSGTWFFGDGDSAVGDRVTHSYADTGNYEVKLEYVDATGCYDEYTRQVGVGPQPDNYFIGLDPFYCLTALPVQLKPNVSGGVFRGDNVNALDSSFIPSQLGTNIIEYVITVPGCRDTFIDSTVVKPYPVVNIPKDTSICVSTNFDLVLDKDGNTFRWSDNSTDSFLNIDAAGLYWVEVNKDGCRSRDSIRVTTIEPPSVDLGPDSLLCGGTYREVDVTADEGVYNWNDGLTVPVRLLDQSGEYIVTVSNKCGSVSDTVNLSVLPHACEIYVPNAFSPNGDQHNPVFRATAFVDITSMLIFNRWGEVIYESNMLNPEWDGTYQGELVPDGVYFFRLTYFLPENGSVVPKQITGEVYVLY